ncbi:MAG: AAA family ATPase [Methanomicrobiaceae archaeon]|uniref:Clp1 P-loop domain-containing protein n=1 Tax=hydrocarbon metagenome TaxID=938273 RepID=A0A0W8FED2_9ZZZZ|nr:AAA family ATPase [Methanomicrobiaceae archaeon]MDD5418520.1 polynucleotide 5'-hydroxyl-kinase [Methanomicrobiaceae archaeon]
MIVRGDDWQGPIRALESGPPPQSMYVLGGTDSGKSTFCRCLIERLKETQITAQIDCDTGQSVIGPPTTMGLAVYRDPEKDPAVYLRFAGSTSPGGHFLQMLTGAKRLDERARREGAARIVIDSPGLVHGDIGREFQFQMIDLLEPDHIVAFQQKRELETILANFRRHPQMIIHRLSISPAVVVRTQIERRQYRETKFSMYFREAVQQHLSLRGLGLHGKIPDLGDPLQVRGRLLAVCDPGQFVLVLGVALSADPKKSLLHFCSPPFDARAAAAVHFGSISLKPKTLTGRNASQREQAEE